MSRGARCSFQLKAILISHLQQPLRRQSFDQIHSLLLSSGLANDYSVLLKLAEALPSIQQTPSSAYFTLKQTQCHPNPFLFISLMAAYARGGSPRSALVVYRHIIRDGLSPDKYALPVALKSCSSFRGVGEARQLHGVSAKLGFLSDVYVQNALVHVYGLLGQFRDAGVVFDDIPVRDVASWTGLISACVKGERFGDALRLFLQMDVAPGAATLVSALAACGRTGEASLGRSIHAILVKRGPVLNGVAGNALLEMYAKCERMGEAKRVFKELPSKDIVTWTSMISGLVHCKQPKEAVELFRDMQAAGVEPDKVVLSSVLSACAGLGALGYGRWIHRYLDRRAVEQDVHLRTALVDMYAKCGSMDAAVHVFHDMPDKNVFSWNALLGGLAMHGHGEAALACFHGMIESGVPPNFVTFIAVLGACAHSGLVKEGRAVFGSMSRVYDLAPKLEHYGCMVDLLGRTGLVADAFELVESMPMRPDARIWGSVLSACKATGDVGLTELVLGRVLELGELDSGVFVLASNVYAAKDRWGDVSKMRKMMRRRGIMKEPGSSVVELDGESHEFFAGETDHHQVHVSLPCELRKIDNIEESMAYFLM